MIRLSLIPSHFWMYGRILGKETSNENLQQTFDSGYVGGPTLYSACWLNVGEREEDAPERSGWVTETEEE